MLRFPNPSSIATFIAIYRAVFERLRGKTVDLDDLVDATIAAGLATSSGYMGEEAKARSTREDRSRDPLYNQLKMYAELFRILGWLHPTVASSLNYTFTLLGEQFVSAGQHQLHLFRECILGINYPNRVLQIQGTHELRPFAFTLRTMVLTDGHLSRDEMILGPLKAASDRTPRAAQSAANSIKKLRANSKIVAAALHQLAEERGVQVNTLKNYTRWPLAVLQYCGWIDDTRKTYEDGQSYNSWAITDEGETVVRRFETLVDLRLDQVEPLPDAERNALSFEAHHTMLKRAGFDLAPVSAELEANHPHVVTALERLKLPADSRLLFSPFQTLSVTHIVKAFPPKSDAYESPEQKVNAAAVDLTQPTGRGSREHLLVAPVMVKKSNVEAIRSHSLLGAEPIKSKLHSLLELHKTVECAAAVFVRDHSNDTKLEFYPLVADLFRVLGYPTELSRYGVNYQRWDACTWLGAKALPIEIKSPTEEARLSTKSLRQAVENKVIILARGGLETSFELPSLIVGFMLPNERGDLSMLIDDIFNTYGLRIGVIDLETLAKLAFQTIANDETLDPHQLSELRGFLNV